MLNNIIGVEEAARILGLSPGTVKNMCAEGKLECKKIGKTWVLDKNNLEVKKMNVTEYTIE
jgi:excisionase family DNA binding protein